jgi:hypothetical protein
VSETRKIAIIPAQETAEASEFHLGLDCKAARSPPRALKGDGF